MPTSSTDLLRSNVAGKYFLKKVLGDDNDVALFLADAPDGSPVHVRLAPDGASVAASWPAIVETSVNVIHPHLLRYLEAGECRLDAQPWNYMVTEAVSDRVDEVLLERPLTTEEADAVLRAALLALSHLHDNGYVHGAPTPASVVAASDLIKLTGDSIKPLSDDESAARRAISAELLEVGELATELLTRAKGPGAAASLPSPYAEFVRAAAGTSACPHPTAMQLMDVLDGKELTPSPAAVPLPSPAAPLPQPPAASAATLPAAAPGAPPVAEPVVPAEVPRSRPVVLQPHVVDELSEERRDTGRRNGTVLLAMLGIAVISLMIWFMRRPKTVEAPQVPVAAAVQPKVDNTAPPATAPQRSAAPRQAPTPTQQGQWGVIAATYGDYGAALKRATQLASRSKQLTPVVLPPPGQGKRYYVVLGTAATRKEADKLRSHARSAGMPGDTYVTRLQF